MRITVRREHAHHDVRTDAPRSRRRLAGLAAAALLLGLVAEIGVVPGFAGAAFSAQVVTADGDPTDGPTDQPTDQPTEQPPVGSCTLPIICQPGTPNPPKTSPSSKPTKKSSSAPSVSAPKKKKHHKKQQHTGAVTAPSPTASATTSDVTVATTTKTSSKSKAPRPSPTAAPTTAAPTPSPSAVAAQEAKTRPVSARTSSPGLPVWVPVAMFLVLVLVAGSVLARRKRTGQM